MVKEKSQEIEKNDSATEVQNTKNSKNEPVNKEVKKVKNIGAIDNKPASSNKSAPNRKNTKPVNKNQHTKTTEKPKANTDQSIDVSANSKDSSLEPTKKELTVKNAILATDIITDVKEEAKENSTVEKISENKIDNKPETNKVDDNKNNEANEDTKKKRKEKTKKEKVSLGQEKTGKASHILAITGIVIASLMLLIIIVFFIFAIMMNNKNTIFSGVSIKNVDVSELSKSNAKLKLDDYIKSKLPEEITLIHNDYETTLNTEELKINFDIDDSIDKAYDLGRAGNIITNGFDIISLAFDNKNIEPKFSIDDETLTNILNDLSGKLPDKVIESGYYIDGNNLILNKGADGVVVDVEKTKSRIKKEIKNLNVIDNKIEIITKDASPKKLNIDEIYEEVHKDAVDATFTREPLAVTPSENGVDFGISLDEARDLLNNDDQESVVPLKVVYPNFTTNMIGTEAFPDKLSEFSTNYAASNVNRTTNLRLAANKINGTVLMPGETFSYNQVVGERSIAAGYKEAPIYVSGRVEDGLGGGICQITTTLYNAVVYANLEIVERTNHQFVPSYVGAGRDATVVYGALDFKFKNNRNYPIKIMCSVSGGVANFKIFGLSTEDDYDVEISSRITRQTANSTNSETYKILKKNGAVVDRVLLSRDTYKRH